MKMSRHWAMPNKNTFSIPVIREFVDSYLVNAAVSADPFSRDSHLTTYTNDMNEDTTAENHVEANIFLADIYNGGHVVDLVIFDPPYSPRQISECYSAMGLAASQSDTQSKTWSTWKTSISKIVPIDGIVLSFGWNTVGMGKKHGFEIVEIMMVCHGGQHNDTICIAEKRIAKQDNLI